MANYVLGPRAARWLQMQMNGRMSAGRDPGGRPCAVDEQSFCHPFELRWAASAGDASGGSPKGAWIIWLPKGSLVVDGSEVDFSTLTAANGYPDGWYDLTESFGESEVPEEFDLYLQPGAKAEFGIDKSKLTDPVLLASVKGKMVKGVVESALVFSASGAPHPWELRRFYDEVLDGGEPVPVWRVWIPSAAMVFVIGSIVKKVVADVVNGPNAFTAVTEPGSSSAIWGSAHYGGATDTKRTAEMVEAGLSGVWAEVAIGEGGGSVYVRIVSEGALHESAVALVTELPSQGDGTINHPLALDEPGFYVKIAEVDADGVITQCVRSMLSLSVVSGGIVQKMITGGTGISVTETNGQIQISATGGGDSGGGGSTGGGDGEDTGTGISGTVVVATAPRYDEGSHQLRYTPVSLTFANGRLTAMESGAETVIAQAVEESA